MFLAERLTLAREIEFHEHISYIEDCIEFNVVVCETCKFHNVHFCNHDFNSQCKASVASSVLLLAYEVNTSHNENIYGKVFSVITVMVVLFVIYL